MLAALLHGPHDLRVERIPHPGPPGPGEILLRVRATGICGSDLHYYQDMAIGETVVKSPVILGHEFAGTVEAAGPATGFAPLPEAPRLEPGTRVAVDPAQPCGQCEMCERGDPHFCRHLHFCGSYPDQGSLCEWMRVPARCCFPLPDSIDDAAGAMLEPLGCAMHAVDLAKIRTAQSVAVLGAGSIGLSIVQLARLSGAGPVFASDKFPWRLDLAKQFGAIPFQADKEDPVERVMRATNGRGVDVAIEAAWAGESIQQAADMLRPGGRLVLVGIPFDDRLQLSHATARRKGLTILVSRRMKHAYPRAIRLVADGRVDVQRLISHRFSLERVAEAFALNAGYRDNVVKVIVDIGRANFGIAG